MLQWVRNLEGRLVRISIPQGAYSESRLNLDQMEYLEGEQHSEYLVERDLNAYRSMRDYRHPLTNAPYGSIYNHSWGNHPNFSWKPRPP